MRKQTKTVTEKLDSLRESSQDERQYTLSYINNSLHLARKFGRIFVRGHYLFREANSFLGANLEENCEPRRRDNVQGQLPEHIFASNGGYCVHYTSIIVRKFPSLGWGVFSNVMRLDQSRACHL